jgi:hypothetical protein
MEKILLTHRCIRSSARPKRPEVTDEVVGNAGAYNHDPFYDADDFCDTNSEANVDSGPVSNVTDADDERTLREFARYDADWSSFSPDAPYHELFPDEDATSLISDSDGCSSSEEGDESQGFASDDETTDESDTELSDYGRF